LIWEGAGQDGEAAALTTLFIYGLLYAFGQLRDFFRKFVDWFKAKNVKVPGGSLAESKIRIR
jgi:hypothetical protein